MWNPLQKRTPQTRCLSISATKTTTKNTHGFLFGGAGKNLQETHLKHQGFADLSLAEAAKWLRSLLPASKKIFTESLASCFYLLGCSFQGINIPVPVNFRDFRSFILTKKTYILIGSGCFLNAGLFFGLWWCDLLNGVLKPPDY